jgi:uncharacterized phage protein (TIGR02220 family)
MVKPTKRKAFNFLRSYFDVFNEIPTDKDKLEFLTSIINKQFLDEDPKGLGFISNLCYESQRHQIESSVNGWKRANKDTPLTTLGTNPPTTPRTDPKEEEEQEKEKGEVQEEGEYTPVDSQQNINDIDFKQLLEFINSHTGKKYRVINKTTKQKYKARLKEGFTNTDIGNAIKNAVQIKYHKENGFQYLTPEFFSRADTINKYSQLNTKENGTSEKKRERTLADKWEQYKNKSAGSSN